MKNVKKDFPLLSNFPDLIYLDSAATTQKPQQVIDAITKFYKFTNAPLYRGVYGFAERATQQFEDARAHVAQFINAAQSSEIIFTSGATAASNMLALSLSQHLTEGDEVIVTELEHHAIIVPWQIACAQKKAILKYIPVTQHGTLDLSTLDTLLTERTKFVAVTQASNALGTLVDLDPIIARAHAAGALVIVDGCQAVPYQKIDVQKMGADFYFFSGHKCLGPTGVGVLYASLRAQNVCKPVFGGGGCVQQVTSTTATFLKQPLGFEAGTQPAAEVAGLSAALTYLEQIGMDRVNQHVSELTSYAIQKLSDLSHIRLLGPIEQLKQQGHMISFMVEGMHAHDVAAYLDTFSICVRAGHHCAQPLAAKLQYVASVRASFHVYTTHQDIDALVTALALLRV